MMQDYDPEDDEIEDGEEELSPPSRAPLFLLGGIIGIVGLAYMTSIMAVPKRHEVEVFGGPFVQQLFEEKISVNLPDASHKRYLQFNLNCVYEAYDRTYLQKRTKDPLYQPLLRDAALKATSSTSLDTVFQEDLLLQKIRDAVEPILFPVHVGSTRTASDYDEESGVRAGDLAPSTTFRGRFLDHVLKVDGPDKTVQLDDGPEVSFEGRETNLEVKTAEGRSLRLDVSRVEPRFEGEVHIGVQGQIRRILWQELIVQ